MQVLKATSSIRRLIASLDICFNNSLNTKVQKQNKNQNKETSKAVDSMILGFIAIHFFNRRQVFLHFQQK